MYKYKEHSSGLSVRLKLLFQAYCRPHRKKGKSFSYIKQKKICGMYSLLITKKCCRSVQHVRDNILLALLRQVQVNIDRSL